MNNKICLALAGLLSVSLLTANEAPSAQAAQYAQAPQSAQAPAPSDSKASDSKKAASGFFEGMEAKGFARMRFTTIEGACGGGADQQHRFRIDLTSGKVDGWSLTTGLMFNYGSSTPTDVSNTNGAAQGSMAVVVGRAFNDRFGISQLSVNKELKGEDTKAEFRAGRISMDPIFSDKNTDIGTGAIAKIQMDKTKLALNFYDSWITSHVIYNLRGENGVALGSSEVSKGSMGNDLISLSLGGENLGGFSYNVSLAHINRLFNYMAFGEAKYDFGGFYVLGQVSAADMADDANFMTGKGDYTNTTWGFTLSPNDGQGVDKYSGFANQDWAKSRGLYNFQIGYKNKENPFSFKLGYLGSFGDGYGTLLDHIGGINIAGKFWRDSWDATNDGFGFMGAGGRTDSSIQVGYLALEYGLTKAWKIGLDYSLVGGDNSYPYIEAILSAADRTRAQSGKGITFHEIAPSVGYKVGRVSVTAYYGQNLGDVTYSKARAEMRYDF